MKRAVTTAQSKWSKLKNRMGFKKKKAKRRVPSKTIKIQDPNENNEKG